MTVAAIFLPLLGAFIVGFFGRWIGDRGSQVVSCAGVGIAAVLAVMLFFEVALNHHDVTTDLFTWIDTGDLQVQWALRFDALSAVMVAVVVFVNLDNFLESLRHIRQEILPGIIVFGDELLKIFEEGSPGRREKYASRTAGKFIGSGTDQIFLSKIIPSNSFMDSARVNSSWGGISRITLPLFPSSTVTTTCPVGLLKE